MGVSDSNLQQPNDSPVDSGAPIPINPNKNCEIPITHVRKIMEEHLPPNVKVSDDAKVIFPPCVSKYISFITAKAYEKCQGEHRKTLNAEDLLWAMENLGFGDYVGPLRDYLNHYRCTKGNLCINHGVSIPINDGQAIYHNGPVIGIHGPICGPMPAPNYGFVYEPGPRPVQVNGPNYGPMPWALYGPTPQPPHGLAPLPGPLPTLEPSLGMLLQSTLSPQPPLSSSQGFLMNLEANLDMFGPTMGTGDGSDGSSDKDIDNFDPLVFLNLNNFENI